MLEVRVSRETTVFGVQARCCRSETKGRGGRGRPLPTDTLPSPSLGRPLRRRSGALAARARGRPQAATHELTGWITRPRGGDGGCEGPAVHPALKCSSGAARRVGPGPSPLLHPGALQPRGCSRRGDRVPRRGATPLPHSQTSTRSVTCREWGAGAELEPWCRRGVLGRSVVTVCESRRQWRGVLL